MSTKCLTGDVFLEAKKLANATTMWKYILDHMYLIRKGLHWILRNGERINFWHDNWMEEAPLTERFLRIVDLVL